MQVTYKLAANGLKQFFVHAYYYDGSVGEHGPFASPEAAVAEINNMEREDAEFADYQAQAESGRNEFPRGEFPF